jgi:hypothetical protein
MAGIWSVETKLCLFVFFPCVLMLPLLHFTAFAQTFIRTLALTTSPSSCTNTMSRRPHHKNNKFRGELHSIVKQRSVRRHFAFHPACAQSTVVIAVHCVPGHFELSGLQHCHCSFPCCHCMVCKPTSSFFLAASLFSNFHAHCRVLLQNIPIIQQLHPIATIKHAQNLKHCEV